MTKPSNRDRTVYVVYGIATLCAVSGLALIWGSRNGNGKKKKSASKKSNRKNRKRELFRNLPTESRLIQCLQTTREIYSSQGSFFDTQVVQVREWILEIAEGEDLQPYSMSVSLECVEWLNAYHAALMSLSVQVARQSPDQYGQAVELQREEKRAELTLLWTMLNRETSNAADKYRQTGLRVTMASSQKWFDRLNTAYIDLLAIDRSSEKSDLVEGFDLSQIVNGTLAAPLIGKWDDFAKFLRILDELANGENPERANIAKRILLTNPQFGSFRQLVTQLKDHLPCSEPDFPSLVDEIRSIGSIRRKMTLLETENKDILTELSDRLDKWREYASQGVQLLVEGASCHVLGLPDKRCLMSGSLTSDKIVAVFKRGIQTNTLIVSKDPSENLWKGTLTIEVIGEDSVKISEDIEFQLADTPTNIFQS